MRAQLEEIVGPESISSRPVRDLWPLGLMKARQGEKAPTVLVVRPHDYEHVAQLLRWANRNHQVVVPIGAATGVCGAVQPEEGHIVLDLTALDRVLEVNAHDLICRTQAGIVGMRLEERLQEQGLTLGHYPSSLPVSTIGGLIATRSSGQESTLHGNIEDMLLGAVVALADGTLLPLRRGPRSAVGPALHQLFAGSEGGLGVILEASLRLHRKPAATIGRGFLFQQLEAGLEAMREVVQAGVRPLVMRLYDADDTAFQGMGLEGCLLVVATAGEPSIAEAEAAFVAQAAAAVGAHALGEKPWEHWQAHRFELSVERLLGFLEAPGSYVDTIELAAGWTALPQLHQSVKALLQRGGIALCHFSHAYGQGCCAYFSFAGSTTSEPDAVAAYEAAWSRTMEAALEAGATISHHHGVGRLRAPWVRQEMGDWWRVWSALREALDPERVLNPSALGGE